MKVLSSPLPFLKIWWEVQISFLYPELICMYLIPGTTTFSRITLAALISKSVLEKVQNWIALCLSLSRSLPLPLSLHFVISTETVLYHFHSFCNPQLSPDFSRVVKDGFYWSFNLNFTFKKCGSFYYFRFPVSCVSSDFTLLSH